MAVISNDDIERYCSELERFSKGERIEPVMTVCVNSKGLVYLFAKPNLEPMVRLEIMKLGFDTMAHQIQLDRKAMHNAKVIDAAKLRKEN